MNENIKRVGRFRFSLKLIYDTDYDMLTNILSNFIIMGCEYLFFDRTFLYTAISHLFDKVPEGSEAPEYTIVITSEAGKKQQVSVKQIK